MMPGAGSASIQVDLLPDSATARETAGRSALRGNAVGAAAVAQPVCAWPAIVLVRLMARKVFNYDLLPVALPNLNSQSPKFGRLTDSFVSLARLYCIASQLAIQCGECFGRHVPAVAVRTGLVVVKSPRSKGPAGLLESMPQYLEHYL